MSAPDGIDLHTAVYLSESEYQWSTILTRTPYGKGFHQRTGHFFTEHGYAYVVQDVRGSGPSGGDETDFFADGRATSDWIAEQPWFDGNLGAPTTLPEGRYSR